MEKIPSPRINLDLNTLKSGLPLDSKGNKFQNFSNRSPRSEALTVLTNLSSPTDSNISPASRSDSLSPATSSSYATEHDHDYENIASPCSSTASGPTYVRPPGFEHHAQEILSSSVKIKKKKTSALFAHRESLRKREPTPPKKFERHLFNLYKEELPMKTYFHFSEPLPMKLRALPQSFWQQPNQPHQVSPGNIFRVLPPLSIKDTGEDVTGKYFGQLCAMREILSGL
ncbi:hypothetical protein LOTGIDRAFT_123177 [Lottia gigantea]|uniref:Uncharacterized protein n=1 Tax=Lottia gigantea TaxID=225164 RepID=V3ZGV6_LOTGI|nr:hypothetical protein LOTGIDRAFT_123177 [Lottia gigantea]ESO90458.1 hypothetical protein LOTGIDRAFT_123177 [Lottia gigantea]